MRKVNAHISRQTVYETNRGPGHFGTFLRKFCFGTIIPPIIFLQNNISGNINTPMKKPSTGAKTPEIYKRLNMLPLINFSIIPVWFYER
jgi:hypothetical protein